jgi:AAA domain
MTHGPDIDQAITWLHGVYTYAASDEWVNVFMQAGRYIDSAWSQVSHLAQLRDTIGNFAERGDVYFSVATRSHQLPGKERGTEADCLHLPGLWLDVDIADGTGAHKLANLPPSVDAAADLIQRFPVPVSGVVRSGHGLQPWWLLNEPLAISEARPVLARWQATWEAMAAEHGWHIDDVSDVTRMMRLPGTINRKSQPVLASFKADWRRHWQLSDLDEQLLDVPGGKSGGNFPPTQRAYTEHLAGHAFNLAVPPGDVLTRAGCQWVGIDEDGEQHYHWPGQSHSHGWTVYPAAPGELWPHATCYSETCHAQTGAPLKTPLSAFACLAWLFHGGDFSAARAWLVANGWPDKLAAGATRPTEASASLSVPLAARPAAGATPREVGWLWRPWLPKAKIVTLDGDPATGKSTMVLDLAARITKGSLMPDGSEAGGQGAVILAAAEDDLEDTVLWRLMAAGADLSQVHYITDDFTIPGDLMRLELLVAKQAAVLVVIDVLYEYLGDGTDSYRDQSVRAALRQVRAMAERTGATVIMLRHFTKAPGSKAIHKGGGSIGVVGAARAGWMVAYHPEDETLRVLAPVKANLAAMPKPQGFRLMPHDVYPCAYVSWTGELSIGTDQLVNPPTLVDDPEAGATVAFAAHCLRQVLTREWQWTDEVMKLIAEWQFAKKTLDRARNLVGVEAKQFGPDQVTGHERGWKIRLPYEGTPNDEAI